MKVRKLETQYNNLQPAHVFTVEEAGILERKYTELYSYALQLERDLINKNSYITMLKQELSQAHRSLGRKHKRIQVIKDFMRMFK